MSKHTPTPWHVEGKNIYSESAYHHVGRCFNFTYGTHQVKELGKANAERIVACVNAFEGIENPTEWMEWAKGELELAKAHGDCVMTWETTMGKLLGEDAPEPVAKRVSQLLEKEAMLKRLLLSPFVQMLYRNIEFKANWKQFQNAMEIKPEKFKAAILALQAVGRTERSHGVIVSDPGDEVEHIYEGH